MTGPRCIVLVGATASGKTAAAHAAALAHGASEIVAADAITVYRGMDLATAKPSDAQRAEVRYHLLDVRAPTEEMSLAEFTALFDAANRAIADRGHRTVVVGGSGLYVRAVVDRLEVPPQDLEVRRAVELEASAVGGVDALFAELRAGDPVGAARVDPRNRRRLVRAVEVLRTTGRPFSSFGAGLDAYGPTDAVQLGIAFDAPRADVAIAERFHRWMDEGLLDEVRALAEIPGGLSRTARQAAGYRQLLDHVEGTVTLDEAVDAAIAATRRLARRQWRWFRRDPRIRWFDDAAAATDALAALL